MPSYDTTTNQRVLRRCTHDLEIAGVASGLADYLDLEVDHVRIAMVLMALIGGLGLPIYLAAWLLVPEEASDTSLARELIQSI